MPASRLKALAQSESKSRFMERLELDENDERHRKIYRMMKEEAVLGRRRMTSNQDVLAPHVKDDRTVEPPYSIAQISETAIHNEVLCIYRTARPETKPYYSLGRSTDGAAEENWVIRWMLWHVFRYRDNRNRNRGQASSNVVAQGSASGDVEPAQQPDHASNASSPTSVTSMEQPVSRSHMWDPVRNTWIRRDIE